MAKGSHMIYFTSDTHFDHENVIWFAGRPYKTVAQMYHAFVANVNARVLCRDELYILGDLTYRSSAIGIRQWASPSVRMIASLSPGTSDIRGITLAASAMKLSDSKCAPTTCCLLTATMSSSPAGKLARLRCGVEALRSASRRTRRFAGFVVASCLNSAARVSSCWAGPQARIWTGERLESTGGLRSYPLRRS